MRALLLALLLSGCGPMLKGPVLPALPTPALRPGHGLPTYDPKRREVVPPRSPHARVLPETPETRKGPGIWAGDRPKAPPARKRGDAIPPMTVLDIPVPHAPDAVDGLDTMPTEQCVGAVNNVLLDGDMRLAKRAAALATDQRACFAALATLDCLDALLRDYMNLPPSLKRPEHQLSIVAALHTASEWLGKVCPPSRPSDEITAILKDMERGNKGGPSWRH